MTLANNLTYSLMFSCSRQLATDDKQSRQLIQLWHFYTLQKNRIFLKNSYLHDTAYLPPVRLLPKNHKSIQKKTGKKSIQFGLQRKTKKLREKMFYSFSSSSLKRVVSQREKSSKHPKIMETQQRSLYISGFTKVKEISLFSTFLGILCG